MSKGIIEKSDADYKIVGCEIYTNDSMNVMLRIGHKSKKIEARSEFSNLPIYLQVFMVVSTNNLIPKEGDKNTRTEMYFDADRIALDTTMKLYPDTDKEILLGHITKQLFADYSEKTLSEKRIKLIVEKLTRYKKIKVGQKVYLRPTGNSHRRDKTIKEAIIETVGRKYVELNIYGKFEIKTGRQKTEFTPDYHLYFDKTELDNLIKSEALKNRIKNSIPKYGSWDVTLEQLEKIAAILNC